MSDLPRLLAICGMAIGLAGPAWAQTADAGAACPVSTRPMARLELFFGAARVSGGVVSREEWEAFLDAEVTPRFPEGLTWFEGRGQWRGRDGAVVREATRMLIVWTEAGATTEAAIEAIRSAYRARFDQESVLRVNGWSCVTF